MKIILNLFSALSLTLAMAACSVSGSSDTVPDNSAQSVYDLQMPEVQKDLTHTFKIKINQSSGYAEYKLYSLNNSQLQFTGVKTNVTNCTASQVVVDSYWYSDDSSFGYKIYTNDVVKTYAGYTSSLKVYYSNISMCTEIEVTLTMKRLNDQVPSKLTGSWITQETGSISQYLTASLTRYSDTDVRFSYKNECYSPSLTTENLQGQVVAVDMKAYPMKMLLKVNQVNSNSNTCIKSLSIPSGSPEIWLACIWQRDDSSGSSPFKLQCQASTTSNAVYPTAFDSLKSWVK